MKQKTHSGLKKRIKKKRNALMVDKACNNHLLVNKSKGQKAKKKGGVHVHPTRVKAVKKLMGI